MLYLFLLLFSFEGFAQSAGNVGNLLKNTQLPATTQGNAGGTVASLSAACQKFNNIQAIASVITPQILTATSPVLPFVGFAVNSVEYESPIIRLCNVLIGIDTATTEGIIKQTAAYGNELSGNKFDAELDMVDKSFNVANSLYDFNDGSTRQGSMTSAGTHQRFVELANSGTKYYNTRFNPEGGGRGLETKAQRQAQLAEVSRLSYQRSIINEATRCPSPKGNTASLAMHSKYTLPREEKIREEDQNIQFYYDMLVRMGQDFNTEVTELQKYMNELNNVLNSGFKYLVTPGTYSEKTSILAGGTDKENKPKRKDVAEKRVVNLHRPVFNELVYTQWRTPNLKKWQDWVKGQTLQSGTFGLLDGKKGRLEAKYRSYAFECTEKTLSSRIGLGRDDPQYSSRLYTERKKCEDNLKVRENDFKNIFDQYATLLVAALKNKKTAETEIWNFEALNLGYNRETRNMASEQSPKDFQRMDVVCSEKLEPAELSKLALKNTEINLSLKETWAKEELKESLQMEAQLKAEYTALEALNKDGKAVLESEKNKTPTKAPGVVIESHSF